MKITESFTSWFNQRNNRSRYLILIFSMLIVFFIFKVFVLNSLDTYQISQSNELTVANNQLLQLIAEEKQYRLLSKMPFNSKLSKELDVLREQLTETVRPIVTKTPIRTSQEMQNFFEVLSHTGPQLHLDHLEHNSQLITIDLHGGYLALLQYLQTISQTPYAFSFTKLDYQVEEYPNAKIKIILQPLNHTIDFYQEGFTTLRDPTKPFNWEKRQNTVPADIKLTGIFEPTGGKSNEEKRIAIINNETYHVGEFVKGYEITKITSNEIYLRNKMGVIVIPLIPEIKSPPHQGAEE